MKKLITSLFVLVSLLLPLASASAVSAAPVKATKGHASVRLHAVKDSGIEGFADLKQLKEGTRITLLGFGLKPGHTYVSLYYGNHTCALEPYSADDVIGGIYTANPVGVGFTHGNADDDLDEINSVSIRDAESFDLLACANVHP